MLSFPTGAKKTHPKALRSLHQLGLICTDIINLLPLPYTKAPDSQ